LQAHSYLNRLLYNKRMQPIALAVLMNDIASINEKRTLLLQ